LYLVLSQKSFNANSTSLNGESVSKKIICVACAKAARSTALLLWVI